MVSLLARTLFPAVREQYPVLALELIADNRTVDLARVEADVALRKFRPNAIASGGGIGIIPCFEAVGRPHMLRVFPALVAFNTGWIVYHESAPDMTRPRATVDALIEFFEAHKILCTGTLPA